MSAICTFHTFRSCGPWTERAYTEQDDLNSVTSRSVPVICTCQILGLDVLR